MKFSHLFTGKPYYEIEKNADALLQTGEYGLAKLEYEKALFKLAKKTSEAPEASGLIESKIAKCQTSLRPGPLRGMPDCIFRQLAPIQGKIGQSIYQPINILYKFIKYVKTN